MSDNYREQALALFKEGDIVTFNVLCEELEDQLLNLSKGKITVETFQSFFKNPNKFFEENGFPVSINYTMLLEDMIKVGCYDWWDEHITSRNFQFIGEGVVNMRLHLVCFMLAATTKRIKNHLDSLGLKPAKLEHLLAFGSKYPISQRNFPIIAFGSSWVDHDGIQTFPCLDENKVKRRLVLGYDWPDREWGSFCRFLAFSK